jgi:hypothetical protein
MKTKIHMVLCPNCRTIQKAGTICPLCKCPVLVASPPPPPQRRCNCWCLAAAPIDE